MFAPLQSVPRFRHITDDHAAGTKILLEERSMLPIGIRVLDARPVVVTRLGPGAIPSPRRVNAMLSGFATHAFKSDITPAFRGDYQQNVTNHTVVTNTQCCQVDQKAVLARSADIERLQSLILGRNWQLNLNLLPLLGFIILFESCKGMPGNSQSQQRCCQSTRKKHPNSLRPTPPDLQQATKLRRAAPSPADRNR